MWITSENENVLNMVNLSQCETITAEECGNMAFIYFNFSKDLITWKYYFKKEKFSNNYDKKEYENDKLEIEKLINCKIRIEIES